MNIANIGIGAAAGFAYYLANPRTTAEGITALAVGVGVTTLFQQLVPEPFRLPPPKVEGLPMPIVSELRLQAPPPVLREEPVEATMPDPRQPPSMKRFPLTSTPVQVLRKTVVQQTRTITVSADVAFQLHTSKTIGSSDGIFVPADDPRTLEGLPNGTQLWAVVNGATSGTLSIMTQWDLDG